MPGEGSTGWDPLLQHVCVRASENQSPVCIWGCSWFGEAMGFWVWVRVGR